MKAITTVVIYITFLALFPAAVIAGQKVESRIGPIDFSGFLLSESRLVDQFGEGFIDEYKVGDKVFSKSRIHYLKDEDLWIKIDLSQCT